MLALRSDPSGLDGGLTSAEALFRLKRDGRNALPPEPRPPVLRRLLSQFFHFFAIMLWIAGALAILAGMLQLGIAIFVVILINGVFAFIQEHRAEKATEKLRDLLPRKTKVIRDGERMEIDSEQLVVGDHVILEMGDSISADLILMEAHSIAIDQSLLTGETVPAVPSTGSKLFAGTFVVEGEGMAKVTAAGSNTRLAAIAVLTRAGTRPESPLAKELDRIVRTIAIFSVIVGILFLGIAILVGISLNSALLFGIGVMVALVPEGLLPTVTVSLAIGAQRMARHHALVRRLESVETLGSTTFICTDKTGTLTLNQMSVVEVWMPSGSARVEGTGYEPTGTIHADPKILPALRQLAIDGARCSTGKAILKEGKWSPQGNPLEVAIDVLTRRLGIRLEEDEKMNPTIRKFPFDNRRRRMSVMAGNRLIVKGAPEAVISRCRKITRDAEKVVNRMANQGLRVLAVATRSTKEIFGPITPEKAEDRLELKGLIGIEDPPRANVADSIAACRDAGIRVAMVTGDHPATARTVAQEVGLLKDAFLSLTGGDLPEDDAVLGALLDRDSVIVSRVSPEQKLRIARALEKRGHVVAMTGDGVNDGPALHEASIGIAMGRSGTDVAREAADLVLLDDNFATIVTAVQQGRSTFANTRRFLTYHLTDNVAELTPFVVWALSGGRFPLALSVLQVLALDIGTDILPALALGAEPPSPREMKRPPEARGKHLIDRWLLIRAFGVQGAVESLMEMMAFISVLWISGWRPQHTFPEQSVLQSASGAAFAAVVIGQMANAFACRSATVWPGALGWKTNPYLIYAVIIEFGILVMLLTIHPLAAVFGQSFPLWIGLLIAVLAFVAVLVSDSLFKKFKRRSSEPVPNS